MGQLWAIVLVAGAIGAVVGFVVLRRSAVRRQRERRTALEQFVGQLPTIDAEFLAAAAATGKPRGLRWTACRLDGSPTFAVDRVNGELFALVAATVSFEAIEGGAMEGVEAVGNLRAATAVFVRREGRWTSDGRVVFNLDPAGTLHHYRDSLEPVVLN